MTRELMQKGESGEIPDTEGALFRAWCQQSAGRTQSYSVDLYKQTETAHHFMHIILGKVLIYTSGVIILYSDKDIWNTASCD